MTDPFYIATTEVEKIQGVHRRARLTDGTEVDFGVHGAIRAYYRLEHEPALPLPVDFVVAAAVG